MPKRRHEGTLHEDQLDGPRYVYQSDIDQLWIEIPIGARDPAQFKLRISTIDSELTIRNIAYMSDDDDELSGEYIARFKLSKRSAFNRDHITMVDSVEDDDGNCLIIRIDLPEGIECDLFEDISTYDLPVELPENLQIPLNYEYLSGGGLDELHRTAGLTPFEREVIEVLLKEFVQQKGSELGFEFDTVMTWGIVNAIAVMVAEEIKAYRHTND
jgi:hypothetical protein